MSNPSKTLALALAPAFGRNNLSMEDVLTGPMVFDKLDWQNPPLKTDATLNGVAVNHYFEVPVRVSDDLFYSFWSDTLYDMYHRPSEVWLNKGIRQASKIFRLPKPVLNYWFSFPEGAPGRPNEFAGLIFSLECAHMYKLTGRARSFIESDDECYVVTESGKEIGVKDGLPILHQSSWDSSAKGFLSEVLRQPRGAISTVCEYGTVDKVRSSLWEHKEKVLEFEGVDYALQALRVLEGTADLLTAMRGLKVFKKERQIRVQSYKAAMEVLDDPKMSDRQKIISMRDILVPEVMTKTRFSTEIFSYDGFPPPALPQSKLSKVRENLVKLSTAEGARGAIKA